MVLKFINANEYNCHSSGIGTVALFYSFSAYSKCSIFWFILFQGKWLLLQFGHNAPSFLASLESLLLELEPMHPDFRCWVSALSDPKCVPIRLLQISNRIQVDTPKVGVLTCNATVWPCVCLGI